MGAVVLVGRSLLGGADPAPRAAGNEFTSAIQLPAAGETPAASRFSPAQVGYVQTWLRKVAPECPPEMTAVVAEVFLEEVRSRFPGRLDRLTEADFPTAEMTPVLLRHAGSKLTGAALAPQREKIAERRVAAVLALESPRGDPATAAAQIAKIRDTASGQHRRLLEGRLEDEELILLLRKTRQPAGEPKVASPAKPKEVSAAEIVSDFGRKNVAGAALQQLQAYTVEGRITDPTGQKQDLLLHKMRPNRFRLELRREGKTQMTLAAIDADRFWLLQPGRPVQTSSGQKMGERRHLVEFLDPLFLPEGFEFSRLDDGTLDGAKAYRIAVRRADGSGHVVLIDPESNRLMARESADQSITRYSDFRDVAGVTLAFREETVDAAGRRTTLEISRITPNPGLISHYFQPAEPAQSRLSLYQKAWATESTPAAR